MSASCVRGLDVCLVLALVCRSLFGISGGPLLLSAACHCCRIPGSVESLEHLLLACPQTLRFRQSYVAALVSAPSLLGSTALAQCLRRSLAVHGGRLLCSVGCGDLFDASGALLVDADAASSAAYAFVRGRLSSSFLDVLLSSVPAASGHDADFDPDAWPSYVLSHLGCVARRHLWRPVWRVWRSVGAP